MEIVIGKIMGNGTEEIQEATLAHAPKAVEQNVSADGGAEVAQKTTEQVIDLEGNGNTSPTKSETGDLVTTDAAKENLAEAVAEAVTAHTTSEHIVTALAQANERCEKVNSEVGDDRLHSEANPPETPSCSEVVSDVATAGTFADTEAAGNTQEQIASSACNADENYQTSQANNPQVKEGGMQDKADDSEARLCSQVATDSTTTEVSHNDSVSEQDNKRQTSEKASDVKDFEMGGTTSPNEAAAPRASLSSQMTTGRSEIEVGKSESVAESGQAGHKSEQVDQKEDIEMNNGNLQNKAHTPETPSSCLMATNGAATERGNSSTAAEAPKADKTPEQVVVPEDTEMGNSSLTTIASAAEGQSSRQIATDGAENVSITSTQDVDSKGNSDQTCETRDADTPPPNQKATDGATAEVPEEPSMTSEQVVDLEDDSDKLQSTPEEANGTVQSGANTPEASLPRQTTTDDAKTKEGHPASSEIKNNSKISEEVVDLEDAADNDCQMSCREPEMSSKPQQNEAGAPSVTEGANTEQGNSETIDEASAQTQCAPQPRGKGKAKAKVNATATAKAKAKARAKVKGKAKNGMETGGKAVAKGKGKGKAKAKAKAASKVKAKGKTITVKPKAKAKSTSDSRANFTEEAANLNAPKPKAKGKAKSKSGAPAGSTPTVQKRNAEGSSSMQGEAQSAKRRKAAQEPHSHKEDAKPAFDEATLARARRKGMHGSLLNLASREEIKSKGFTGSAILEALIQSKGLVNTAKHALLGA